MTTETPRYHGVVVTRDGFRYPLDRDLSDPGALAAYLKKAKADGGLTVAYYDQHESEVADVGVVVTRRPMRAYVPWSNLAVVAATAGDETVSVHEGPTLTASELEAAAADDADPDHEHHADPDDPGVEGAPA